MAIEGYSAKSADEILVLERRLYFALLPFGIFQRSYGASCK
jgi:hypothetical protein